MDSFKKAQPNGFYWIMGFWYVLKFAKTSGKQRTTLCKIAEARKCGEEGGGKGGLG